MRRRRAEKRKPIPDPKFGSEIVGKFINIVMLHGKRSVAEKIVYECLDQLQAKLKEDPLKIFFEALDNARPRIEVRSRRIGGATYQIPMEVTKEKGFNTAMCWIRDMARKKKGKPMSQKLAEEFISAYRKEGAVIKKRDDTHKMAEANMAFAHFKI